ncbi:CBP80/20-dependent translation initiation factor-like isoform X2 [Mytilus californianus]|uniref:CBP80/20-dependent translation initiation factor-like isoform X2 n=1 Tax=Mytilus californianus TaxID=6549 RepID=UPI002246896A|nr:CBP80/20-dependent translation initiation factor-like isoform X2 [Mytilus californianus]
MSGKVRSYANVVSMKKEQRSTSLSPRRNQQVYYNRRTQSYERGKHQKIYDVRDCDGEEKDEQVNENEYMHSVRKDQNYLHQKGYDEERYIKSKKCEDEEYTRVSPNGRTQESVGTIFIKKGNASTDQQSKLNKLNSFLQGILSKQVEKRLPCVLDGEQLIHVSENGRDKGNVKSLTAQQENVRSSNINEHSVETSEIKKRPFKNVSPTDLGNTAKSIGGGIEELESLEERETENIYDKDCHTALESAREENQVDMIKALVNNTEDDQSASCMNDLEQLIETLTLEPEEEDIAKIQTMADTVKTSSDLKELANIIYNRCIKDREFGKTGACLCDRLANMEVEGSKFRNIMLSLVQIDYKDKDSLRTKSPGRFLGFVTFLCQVFGNMRTAKGEPFNVLSGPIYDCIYTIFDDDNSSDDDYECLLLQIQSIGKELEAFDESKMSELMEKVRTKIIKDGRSARARCSLLELLESYSIYFILQKIGQSQVFITRIT